MRISQAQAGVPRIGIFWFEKVKGKFRLVLPVWCAISDGVEEGEYVSFPESHKKVWGEYKDIKVDGAFDETLRGRVFFNKVSRVYEVHTGYAEVPKELMGLVIKEFRLPVGVVGVYDDIYGWGVGGE